MKAYVALLPALLAATSAGGQPAPPAMQYLVGPKMNLAGLEGLAVEFRFRGDADGSTAVILPQGEGGFRPDGIPSDVRVVGGRRVGEGKNFSIEHAPGADVQLHYVIRPPAPPTTQGPSVSPAWYTVQPTRFTTPASLVLATLPERQDEPASFTWGAFPKDWKLISDLQMAPSFSLGSYGSAILMGGTDMRILDTGSTVNKAPFALHAGELGFAVDEMAAYVGAAMNASAAYWGRIAPNILTAMIPATGQVEFRFATTTDDLVSFWTGAEHSFETLRPHMAHEVMHTYVPYSTGHHAWRRETNWLGEGLNDFYAFRVMLWGDVWSWDTYALETNKVLGAYGVSSARNMPAEIANGAPPANEVRLLPYQQGHLLGLLWDYRIRQATGGKRSMNDVARRAVALAKAGPTSAVDNFRLAFEEISGGQSIDGDITRYLARGETIRLPADIFGACATVVDEERAPYSRGFASLGGDGLIGGVDPASRAYAAGIRDGMRLIERVSGEPGNSAVELALRVADTTGEKVVRYMPTGKKVIVQRVVPTPGGDARNCARLVSHR